MPETDRLSGDTDWIELGFIERERTPPRLIEMSIQLHLTDLSPSNTEQYLETLVSIEVEPPSTTGSEKLLSGRPAMERQIR